MPPERCVLLLAGGASTRLGRDKRLAHVGGQPLCARVVAAARSTGLPVFAAIAPGDVSLPGLHDVALLEESPPRGGALRAVAFWLRVFEAELLVLAADLPLLSSAVLLELLEAAGRAPEAQAVVARTPGGLEPLCALYRPGMSAWFQAALAHGELSLSRTLSGLPAGVLHCIDAAPAALLNVNDSALLAAARSRV